MGEPDETRGKSTEDLEQVRRQSDYLSTARNETGLAHDIDPTEMLKEATALYRHYGTLRFAMLTVFLVATSGLIGVFLSGGRALSSIDLVGFRAFGIVFSLVMGLHQLRGSLHQEHYQAVINEVCSKLAGASHRCVWHWNGRIGTVLVHGGAVILWLVLEPR